MLARQGAFDEAEFLARGAVTISEQTDFLTERAAVRLSLAEVLERSGRLGEATAGVQRAILLLDAKGAVVPADRAGADLARLESRLVQ